MSSKGPYPKGYIPIISGKVPEIIRKIDRSIIERGLEKYGPEVLCDLEIELPDEDNFDDLDLTVDYQ